MSRKPVSRILTTSLALLFAALALGACTAERTPPATPGDADLSGNATKSDVDSDEQTATVAVAEDIRKACALAYAEARFSYNSSKLRSSDSTSLEKLAACFTDGPLRGRKMGLIGRADPRGQSEYNLALGGRRAGSVEQALKAHRVLQSQIATTSRGALDATGRDEQGWAWDRRVDVTLAD